MDSGASWVSSPVPLCDADTCGDGLASQHLDYAFAFGQDQDGKVTAYARRWPNVVLMLAL